MISANRAAWEKGVIDGSQGKQKDPGTKDPRWYAQGFTEGIAYRAGAEVSSTVAQVAHRPMRDALRSASAALQQIQQQSMRNALKHPGPEEVEMHNEMMELGGIAADCLNAMSHELNGPGPDDEEDDQDDDEPLPLASPVPLRLNL